MKHYIALALVAAVTGPMAPATAEVIEARAVQPLHHMVAPTPDTGLGSDAAGVTYSRAWIDQQKKPTGGAQWRCLSEALYFEARGESIKGQFAVAEVILNRVDSGEFPDTVCKVVHQGTGRRYACQFTYTCDGVKEVIGDRRSFAEVGKVARTMIDGAARRLTDGATYYHTRAVTPRWARRFQRTATIGAHEFYRAPTRLSQN